MHKKTQVALGLALTLGTAASSHATVVDMSFSGWLTVLNHDGTEALVNGDYAVAPMDGRRTPIAGTFSADTMAGTGSATIAPVSFFGSGFMITNNLSFQAIGDGAGSPGTLLLGNWTSDWAGTIGTPRSIVLDAAGLFSALNTGVTTSDVITGGALSATEDSLFSFGKTSYTLPLGPGPMVATTWNTTPIGTPTLGDNPSGSLPLIDDGIAGSPDVAGATVGFNFTFDVLEMHVTSVNEVPVPAAVWLFGSGLVGLIGVARRRHR